MSDGLKGMFELNAKVKPYIEKKNLATFNEAMIAIPVDAISSVIENIDDGGSIVVFRRSFGKILAGYSFSPLVDNGAIYSSENSSSLIGRLGDEIDLLKTRMECFNIVDGNYTSDKHFRLIAVPVEGVKAVVDRFDKDFKTGVFSRESGSFISIEKDYGAYLDKLSGHYKDSMYFKIKNINIISTETVENVVSGNMMKPSPM